MSRPLGLAGFLLALCLGAGVAAAGDAAEMSLSVTLDPRQEPPYEQEMVLLTIRGLYSGTVARERLEQPVSRDFGWAQLGDDSWSDAPELGRQARRFERRLALFPQRAGRVEIPSFVHHLTLLDDRGRRRERTFRSPPVAFDVQPRPAGVDWWLPVAALRLTEDWDTPPDRLGLGDLARRSVTLVAEGMGPEWLPPPPELRTTGLIAFSDPETRAVRLSAEGLVSRVTWRWTVKPVSDAEARIEAVTIPWFDTRARRLRELVLPARTIGLAAGAVPAGRQSLAQRLVWPLGLVFGCAIGLSLYMPGLRPRRRREIAQSLRRLGLLPDLKARALVRAAKRGDPAALRMAACRLFSGVGDRQRRLPPSAARALSGLDRCLYDAPSDDDVLDLPAIARTFLRAHRDSCSGPEGPADVPIGQ